VKELKELRDYCQEMLDFYEKPFTEHEDQSCHTWRIAKRNIYRELVVKLNSIIYLKEAS